MYFKLFRQSRAENPPSGCARGFIQRSPLFPVDFFRIFAEKFDFRQLLEQGVADEIQHARLAETDGQGVQGVGFERAFKFLDDDISEEEGEKIVKEWQKK